MRLFFADDSAHMNPTRPGMGPLFAFGGVSVPADSVRKLESEIDSICREFGIPDREEFKWSPGRALWMRTHLVGDDRMKFYQDILTAVSDAGGVALVAMEDISAQPATATALTREQDVVRLLLERVNNYWESLGEQGLVVCDQHGGKQDDEKRFLIGCLDTFLTGTEYVNMGRLMMNVVATPSDLCRLIQVADVVTSCTLAFVAGESRYSPHTFAQIAPMLWEVNDRIGGLGVKLHPDGRYRNLYHWLLGDTELRNGEVLPSDLYPYFRGSEDY